VDRVPKVLWAYWGLGASGFNMGALRYKNPTDHSIPNEFDYYLWSVRKVSLRGVFEKVAVMGGFLLTRVRGKSEVVSKLNKWLFAFSSYFQMFRG
jgi:hypothetical protein